MCVGHDGPDHPPFMPGPAIFGYIATPAAQEATWSEESIRGGSARCLQMWLELGLLDVAAPPRPEEISFRGG